ncbi:gram-negative bacterial tonB protein [mine drainage metagenome]|uniref:Gram-negative bacterial tonB protein n=1 Tax=mine drainage metagenome TaxID=410659 RepID=A0A1J5S0S5_9ZZZZ
MPPAPSVQALLGGQETLSAADGPGGRGRSCRLGFRGWAVMLSLGLHLSAALALLSWPSHDGAAQAPPAVVAVRLLSLPAAPPPLPAPAPVSVPPPVPAPVPPPPPPRPPVRRMAAGRPRLRAPAPPPTTAIATPATPAAPAAPVAATAPVAAVAAPAAAVRRGERDDARLRRYEQQLWAALLAHKPRGLPFQGTVLLAFTLSPAGALQEARVARSAGMAVLDRAALAALRAAAPLPPPPPGLTVAQRHFSIPFTFQ